MSFTKSAKGVFWQANETMELQMTAMPYENKYGDVVEWIVGEKKWDHFIDAPEGKKKRVTCEGMGKCTHCSGSNRATLKLLTIVKMGDKEYYCDMGVSLARLVGDRMHMMQEMGKSPEEIMDTVFIIRKLPDRPYWQVNVKPAQAKPAAPTVKPTPAPAKAAPVPVKTSDLDDLDAADDLLNETVKLSEKEVDHLRKYENTLILKLSKDPHYNGQTQVSIALKNSGWPSAKIEVAHRFFDYATGQFKLHPGLIEA